MSENQEPMHFLEAFCNPRSIAFYGANEQILTNMGTQQLLNLMDNGYTGKIYPIHLRLESVLGIKAYQNIAEVPEVPDLAMIVLPKRVVPQVFKELGEKGVKNIVLVTAGFRETANAKGEDELRALAKEYDLHFLGPNCIGFLNTHCDVGAEEKCMLNCTWVNYLSGPGNVSIASQSGTFACHNNFILPERDLHMSKAFSVGNEANIDLCDCLEYLEQDPTTEIILLYIEEIKRGQKFLEIAKRIVPKKPIIAIYVGGTEAGSKAVASHTGSIAGNDKIFNAAFKQTGIIRVYTWEELMDTAVLFSKLLPRGIIPKSNKIAIVTNSGGPGATMADRASRRGLKLPTFSAELQEKLRKYLPKTAQASNPLDYTFSINPDHYFNRVPRLLAKSGEVDAIVAYGAFGPKFFQYQSIGKKLMEEAQDQGMVKSYIGMAESAIDSGSRLLKRYKVPIIYINTLGLEDEFFSYLLKKGFPTFRMPHQAIDALTHFIEYQQILQKRDTARSND